MLGLRRHLPIAPVVGLLVLNLAIGFTTNYEWIRDEMHLGGTHGPLASHILIRETAGQVSEPERLEVLTETNEWLPRLTKGHFAITGGDGFDTVTYATRTNPVAVTLDDVNNDGEAGEADNVLDDVEIVNPINATNQAEGSVVDGLGQVVEGVLGQRSQNRKGDSATKQVLRWEGMTTDELWHEQNELVKTVFTSADAREGSVAFAERRAPNWQGR